jgi:ParB/RepB/Spo0J family partition protein
MDIIELKITDLHDDDSFNCRGKITPIDVIDLAKDIKEHGLHQPIVVSAYDDAKQMMTGKKYRVLAGFRRIMAHRVNDVKTITAVVKPPMSEIEALKVNLSENIQRANLTILQEALAIKRLKEYGVTENDTANQLGMSRGWVQVRFMLLSLPEEIQKEASAGYISQTNIRDLYSLYKKTGDKQQIFESVKRLKEGKERGQEVKVAQTKEQILSKKCIRKRSDIFAMMEHIQESAIGNGPWTRAMAWCAGEISTGQLIISLQKYATYQNIDYVPLEIEEFGVNNGE